MANIRFRMMPDRQSFSTDARRMGYLSDDREDAREDLWPKMRTGDSQQRDHWDRPDEPWGTHWGKPSGPHYPADMMDPTHISMRMKELDEEKVQLERAMQQLHSMPMADALDPKLTEKLEELFSEAVEIAANPPDTWKDYLRKKDYAGIVGMESKELLDELKKNKLPKDLKKEITHTLAAIIRAGA